MVEVVIPNPLFRNLNCLCTHRYFGSFFFLIPPVSFMSIPQFLVHFWDKWQGDIARMCLIHLLVSNPYACKCCVIIQNNIFQNYKRAAHLLSFKTSFYYCYQFDFTRNQICDFYEGIFVKDPYIKTDPLIISEDYILAGIQK